MSRGTVDPTRSRRNPDAVGPGAGRPSAGRPVSGAAHHRPDTGGGGPRRGMSVGGTGGGARGVRPGSGRFGGKIETPENFKKAIGRLIKYFGNEWKSLIVVSIGIISGAILKATAPARIGQAIRRHIEIQPEVEAFVRAMVTVLLIYLFAWIADALSSAFTARIGNRLVYRMRRDTFNHLQSLSMSYFDNRGIGDIISRVTNDIEMIYNALTNGFTNLLGGLFSIVGILIAMLILDLRMSLVVLAMLPVMIVTTATLGKLVRKAFRTNQRLIGQLTGRIAESISTIKVIKSFHRERRTYESFTELNAEAKTAGIKAEVVSFILFPIMRMMNGVTLALVVGIGGALVTLRTGEYSIGLLTAFILYARRFFEPLRQVTNVYNLIQSALAGAERVFEIIDSKPQITNRPDAKHIDDIKGDVEFRQVSFGYLPDQVVLEGIDLEARSGEVVAIVGPTGAGKTTLVNLLSRFYDARSGSILIDGTDIRDIEINSLRTKMGVVLQEPYFFSGSIIDNICYGNAAATSDDAIRAATLSKADSFVRRLPEQYETKLLERGTNISQGERQLLAIARAILADPAILILDEATSSVDTLTESLIQRGLLELMKGRTSFVIAHRLSTIRNADKVLVVHDRRIVERGTHDELMKADGFYSRLYRLQFEKPEITEDMDI